jgi:hypothetical protein
MDINKYLYIHFFCHKAGNGVIGFHIDQYIFVNEM